MVSSFLNCEISMITAEESSFQEELLCADEEDSCSRSLEDSRFSSPLLLALALSSLHAAKAKSIAVMKNNLR